MIIGIDPGVSGAIVVLMLDGTYVAHLEMPTVKNGKSSRVNGAAIAAFLKEGNRVYTHAFIEKVGAMPGQGVTSMFTFGHAAGLVEGVVTGAGIPLTFVTPQTWKKTMGLMGVDKDAARSRAIQLYPKLRILEQKGKGQAVADALLIARHGADIRDKWSLLL
jgi:crossover junction endodeoxyribonuclease RuvC